MKLLNELNFVDLIIGNDFTDIKGMAGATSFLTELPYEYLSDAEELKKECTKVHNSTKKTEFSIRYNGRIYRITVTSTNWSGASFVIRQTPESILPFSQIPLTTPIRQSIECPGATGLFLIAGEMGNGKTTTAASSFQQRIKITGGLGVSIEDPIESLLEGRHGKGRCLQLEVEQGETYATATKKAWRMGASCLFLGEIRDGITAHEVLKASLSMFVVSTIHASSVYDAIDRYVMFCEEINQNAKQNIANTLYLIAHQKMQPLMRGGEIVGRDINITAYDLIHSTQSTAIKAKIANGNFRALQDEFSSINYKFN